MLPPPLHQKSNLPVGHAPNSSSHILLASPNSCSCWAVLCWIRFSLSMRLRNTDLVIQRYGHTTRKQRCIPVFGYAFHSHLGLGQSMGITVGQKDDPQPKGQGQPERRWINMEPVGGIKPPAAGHQASSITYPGKGQGPGTRLSLGPWKREEIWDNPNFLFSL